MGGKRFIVWGVLLALLLAGCQRSGFDFKEVKSDGIFVYPKTQWNMTPEEVMTALSLTEEQFVQVSETETAGCRERLFLSAGRELCSVPADLYFWFRSYSEDSGFGLKSVTWMLEEGADLEPVRSGIEDALGPMDNAHAEYPVFSWDSEDSLAQYMRTALGDSLNETLVERKETEPAATLTLVDDPPVQLPIASYPAVDAHAKMVILSSNAADVMQLSDAWQKNSQ